MRFFNNLSTRTKLILGFGLLWLILAIVIVIADLVIIDVTNSEKELNKVHLHSVLMTEKLRFVMDQQRVSILQLLLTEDKAKQDSLIKGIKGRAGLSSILVDSLRLLNSESDFLLKLSKIDSIRDNYRKTREIQIGLVEKGEIKQARDLGLGIQELRFDTISKIISDLSKDTQKAMDDQVARDKEESQDSRYLFIIMAAVGLLGGILLVMLMNIAIVVPLNKLSILAEKISGRNDLNADIPVQNRKDEIGRLGKAFKQMLENLRGSTTDISQLEETVNHRTHELSSILKEVKDTVNVLAATSSEILAASTQVATGAVQTAASITETSTTVEEVRQAAQLSSQKAAEVSENAHHVVQISQDGQKAVDETVHGMDHIRQQMELIAQAIIKLSEQSQSIGGIIASVSDVADQSNLLAVNAAIEAAKAGEQGKGFAVVAQEIKSLAEQSKKATNQVRTILFDVQKATSAAVMAAEQGNKAVEAGVKQSIQAGEAINILAVSTQEAANVATQIVASSKQQLIGMDQIGVAIRTINQAGGENAASMKQVKQSAQDLNELGLKLKALVANSKF